MARRMPSFLLSTRCCGTVHIHCIDANCLALRRSGIIRVRAGCRAPRRLFVNAQAPATPTRAAGRFPMTRFFNQDNVLTKPRPLRKFLVILPGMRGLTIATVTVFVGVAACSGGQTKTDSTALTLEEFEENSEQSEAEPTDPMANPSEGASDQCSTECLSDKDCCEGYYCGKDPERSPRKDYCLPGG